VEPPIVERSAAVLLERDKPWYEARLPILDDRVRARLGQLSSRLGDADRDLDHFPSRAFDYAILSQTLQATRNPRHVLSELLRIADKAVVTFPNFGHWRVRLGLLIDGRMPETRALPEPWWSTPNIHLCTLADFNALCKDLDLRVETCSALSGSRPARPIDPSRPVENLRAETVLFFLSRRADEGAEPAAPKDDLFEG
jgi:methionine biosynthesis protein MetW